MFSLLIALSACEPSTTSASGVVGRLLDGAGMPVEGVRVESLEGAARTDAEGRFAVPYKPPDQLVHFQWHGAWYQRPHVAADEGKVVEIRLPLLRESAVDCAVACPLQLAWRLDDGLEARATARCEPGRELVLVGIPRPPATTATCEGATVSDGERIGVARPAVPVRVEVRGEEGSAPEACVVRVGEREATPSGAGFYVAEASGIVTVAATCDGRPAVPQKLDVDGSPEPQATLEWSPDGPSLDLSAVPLAGDLWLVHEGEQGWMIRVAPAIDGSYPLPPLPAGLYRVGVGDPAALVTVAIPAASEPGTVRVLAVTPGDGVTPGGLVGVLRVEEDLLEGPIPIVGL